MARERTQQSARAGTIPAIIVNGALLYLANVWPGWWILPFLTPRTSEVMGPLNATWIAAIVVNVVVLLVGFRAVDALGQIAVLIFGLVAMFRLWGVFPFDFGATSFDWALVVRILLVLGIVGGFIGIVAQLVRFVRSLMPHDHPRNAHA